MFIFDTVPMTYIRIFSDFYLGFWLCNSKQRTTERNTAPLVASV